MSEPASASEVVTPDEVHDDRPLHDGDDDEVHGAITEPAQVNTILACRRADLVALARPHLFNPYFTQQAAAWYGAKVKGWQPQYISGKGQAYREAEKTREKARELAIKAKPKRHAVETPLKQAAE